MTDLLKMTMETYMCSLQTLKFDTHLGINNNNQTAVVINNSPPLLYRRGCGSQFPAIYNQDNK